MTKLLTVPANDAAWLRAALADVLGAVDPAEAAGAEAAGAEALAARGGDAGGSAVLPLPAGDHQQLPPAELAAALAPDTALVIHTSGSTGVPKYVELSRSALLASAHATHSRLGGPGQWLITLPLHLVSGAQQLVRGIVAGTDPVCYFGSPFNPAELLDRAEAMTHDRRYVSLVPSQFVQLLELCQKDADALQRAREFAAILVGGGGLSVAQRQLAHELHLPLVCSYGASETAGGCVYDGVEIGDTGVRIRDGEVQLTGSCLATGYPLDPELTAARFITETAADGSTRRWYRTGDSGKLLGGMLTVTGRLDRVLISGGVNVSLDRVEQLAAGVPGVGAVLAVAIPSERWGQSVALLAVAGADPQTAVAREEPEAETQHAGQQTDQQATQQAEQQTEQQAELEQRLIAALTGEIGKAAKPARIRWVTELPQLPGGKPDYLTALNTLQRLS